MDTPKWTNGGILMEEKMLLAQILDKSKQAKKQQKVECTDFLDMYQVSLAKKIFNQYQIQNVLLYGGYEEAERKIAVFYPENDDKKSELLKIVRIQLGNGEQGKYTHRNYLGGIIKIGIKREKVGDILVTDDGADIIVKAETAEILSKELGMLTRFQNSKISIEEIENIREPEIKIEEIDIIVPSLRLDSVVSDLAKTSRSKAIDILSQERVFINGQSETKPSKNIKIGDIITIRGKGRFIIKEMKGNTRSGRNILRIEKYV